MPKTIADAIRNIDITPETLGMATIGDKIRRGEAILAVVGHSDGSKDTHHG